MILLIPLIRLSTTKKHYLHSFSSSSGFSIAFNLLRFNYKCYRSESRSRPDFSMELRLQVLIVLTPEHRNFAILLTLHLFMPKPSFLIVLNLCIVSTFTRYLGGKTVFNSLKNSFNLVSYLYFVVPLTFEKLSLSNNGSIIDIVLA